MTRKEKQIIIDKVQAYFRITEKQKEIYFNKRTAKNKKNWEYWNTSYIALEILAKNLGINIDDGIVGGASEAHMQRMKEI